MYSHYWLLILTSLSRISCVQRNIFGSGLQYFALRLAQKINLRHAGSSVIPAGGSCQYQPMGSSRSIIPAGGSNMLYNGPGVNSYPCGRPQCPQPLPGANYCVLVVPSSLARGSNLPLDPLLSVGVGSVTPSEGVDLRSRVIIGALWPLGLHSPEGLLI